MPNPYNIENLGLNSKHWLFLPPILRVFADKVTGHPWLHEVCEDDIRHSSGWFLSKPLSPSHFKIDPVSKFYLFPADTGEHYLIQQSLNIIL